MKISLCIPMYNESSIIEATARTLSDYMEQNFDEYEILFCNDGSTDGCDALVEQLHLPNVKVVGYEQNRGKGCAVRTGMLAATGDYVMFTDADLAYGTDVIGQAVRTFEENPQSGIVIGSRPLHPEGYAGYTFSRKVASKTYIKVLCLIGGFRLSDSQCGCKAFTNAAAKEIFSRCKVDGFAFDFEALMWAELKKIKITEMPVKIINHRDSKISLMRDTFRMLKDLMRIRKEVKAASKEEKKN